MSYWHENWEGNFGDWEEDWRDSSASYGGNWRYNSQNDWRYGDNPVGKGQEYADESRRPKGSAPKGGKGKPTTPDAMTRAFMKGKAQGLSMAEDHKKGDKTLVVDLPIQPAVSSDSGETVTSKQSHSKGAPHHEPVWRKKGVLDQKDTQESDKSKKKYNKMAAWLVDEKDINVDAHMWEAVKENSPQTRPSSRSPVASTTITPLMLESLNCVIQSLYRDRIKPTTKVLKERLMERFSTPNPNQRALIEHFPSACLADTDTYRVESRANDSIYYLRTEPNWFEGWVELEGIVEDEYGDSFWMDFSNYIDDLKAPLKYMEAARCGDRNEELLFAKELREQALRFIQNKSLGELCAVVRLARSKGLLVFRGDNDYLREV